MSEPFMKVQGLGNDFVVLDRRASGELPSPEQVRALCDRHRGIGADGVLCLLPGLDGAVAHMRVLNADGSIPEMCGNGLRCVVRFLSETLPGAEELLVSTDAGPKRCRLIREAGEVVAVEVEMGRPSLAPADLPLRSDSPWIETPIPADGRDAAMPSWRATAVSMGNPHLIVFDGTPGLALAHGPRLELHPALPNRTNVEFVAVRDGALHVEVWERGVGITQACGTGACAALVAAVVTGRLPEGVPTDVHLPGGPLRITVEPGLSGVRMRGEARLVFRGELPA